MVSLYKGDAELQVICFVVLVWFWSRINFDYNALNIRLQATYLKEEYALDLAIHKLAVPYVSIMDGITMGGGCGISVNGRCHHIFRKQTNNKNILSVCLQVPCGHQANRGGDA